MELKDRHVIDFYSTPLTDILISLDGRLLDVEGEGIILPSGNGSSSVSFDGSLLSKRLTKIEEEMTTFQRIATATPRMLSQNSTVVVENRVSVASLEVRFRNLILTRCATIENGKIVEDGERVMLPYFGSKMHKLIDKPFDYEWVVTAKKYLFECFFDETEKLWDRDFEPSEVVLTDLNVETGSIDIEIKFENGLEFSFGYTV